MPIVYVLDESLQLVYAAADGPVTLSELTEHLEALARDPRYVPPMKKLVDYRGGGVIAMSVEETRRLTEFKLTLGDAFRGEKCAFVVGGDVDFGLSRVSGAYADPTLRSEVFRDMAAALAWLEVDPIRAADIVRSAPTSSHGD